MMMIKAKSKKSDFSWEKDSNNYYSRALSPERQPQRRLHDAGEIPGMKLLDHMIFASRGYYSLLAAGSLQPWKAARWPFGHNFLAVRE